MNKSLVILLIAFFSVINLEAQTVKLQGRVVDQDSGNPLSYSTIHSLNEAVYADEQGFYVFQYIPASETDSVFFQFVGFDKISLAPPVAGLHTINISLQSNLTLPSVEVRAPKIIAPGGSIIAANIAHLKSVPVLAGEEDLLKSLTTLPGITSGVEGTANLQIRGGSADQTQVFIDGSPIYYANHLGGFLSAVSPFSIKGLNVYKAGVPAKFGGRLSGMVDILLKDGNQEKATGEFSVGSATVRAGINTHFGKKDQFHAAIRYAYPFKLLNLSTVGSFKKGETGNRQDFTMYDVIAKYTFDVNENNKLSASFFQSGDVGIIQEVLQPEVLLDDFRWQNRSLSLRWYSAMNNNILLKINPVYSSFSYQYDGLENDISIPDSIVQVRLSRTLSEIEDIGVNIQMKWQANNDLNFELGATSIHHKLSNIASTTRRNEQELVPKFSANSKGWENAAFVSVEAQLLEDKLTLNGGLRGSNFSGNSIDNKWTLEPRFRLSYALTQNLFLNAGYEKHKQYAHQLQVEGSLLPNDIWVLSRENAVASSSKQVYLGLSGAFSKVGIEWYLEAYAKKYDQLIQLAFEESGFAESQVDWTERIYTGGTGTSKGIELSVTQEVEKFDWAAAYTYSFSDRKFAQINNGASFPFTYDRRHVGNLSFGFEPNLKWRFNLLWTYQSGNAVTLPITIASSSLVFGSYNGQRMPNFHRLDLSFTKSWTAKKHQTNHKSLTFSLYNSYNRANPHEILIRPVVISTTTEQGEPLEINQWRVFQLSLFPIIPSLSYKIQFQGKDN